MNISMKKTISKSASPISSTTRDNSEEKLKKKINLIPIKNALMLWKSVYFDYQSANLSYLPISSAFWTVK
jgi:uncharacterized protein (DUF1919 family)